MSKEKFNSLEYMVFQLIREGKTRDEITACGLSTPANIGVALVNIYEKTDGIVPYHSARSKFTELQGYLRNHPNAFTPIPDNIERELICGDSDIKTHKGTTPLASIAISSKLNDILTKLNEQYNRAVEANKAKLSVLEDIKKEIEEAL